MQTALLVLGGRAARSATLLALDRSLRSIDADGHMRVEESRISKGNICPYLGREIPEWEKLKLDPTRTYRLFRDPKELEKGASTFDGKPLLIRHVPVTADLPRKELWVGSVGPCTFEDPYLITRPLMVLTKEAIDLIESKEQRELSAAYRYDAVMEPGAWGGQQYDGRMVNIRGNHVAIVTEGRAGPDVHVADELPEEFRAMKRTVAAHVAAAIKPYLGKDANNELIAMALDGMLGETPAESVLSLDEEEKQSAEDEALAEKKKEHGEDAELDDKEKEQAYERARDRKRAKDKKGAKDKRGAKDAKTDDAEDAAAHLTGQGDGKRGKDGKHAKDGDPDHRKDFNSIRQGGADGVTKDEMTAAVKAAVEATEKKARDAAVAREAVRPLVGVVSMALDSAEAIYTHALKNSGIKTEGVHPDAFPALVETAIARTKAPRPNPALALDAAAADLCDVSAIFGPQKSKAA